MPKNRKATLLKVVPLELRAMPVNGAARNRYASLNINYLLMSDQMRLAKSIETSPFIEWEDEKPGIHLHWILPDFLTNGKVDETGSVIYPAVPNRWLVTRMWQGEGGKILSRRFLVESDCLLLSSTASSFNEDSQSYPFPEDSNKPYRFLGRSAPYGTDLPAVAERLEPLGAVAPGSPYFSSFYPFCRNVFGFVDTFKDGRLPGETELTYSVCGWYDPPVSVKNNLVCHGMVCDILLDADGNPSPSHFTAGTTSEVAVGNTSDEAWAAMDGPITGPDNERQMRYFLTGLLDRLAGPNGVRNAEQTLHTLMFESYLTPKHFEIKPRDDGEEKSVPPLSDIIIERLRKMNDARNELRRLRERLAYHARRAYDYWCAYSFAASFSDLDLMKKLQATIDKECEAAVQAANESDSLNTELANAERELREALPGQLKLTETPADRFWQPNNPVVLFRGVKRGFSFGFDGRFNESDRAEIRITDDILVGVKLDSIPGSKSGVTLKSEDLITLDSRGDLPIVVDLLTCEAALISTSLAQSLASQAFALAGVVPTDEQVNRLKETITHLQTLPFVTAFNKNISFDITGAAGFIGVFPSKISVNHFHSEWLPMVLEWQADYLPDMNVLKPTPSLENWKLGDDDFDFTGTLSEAGKTPLSGRIIVTPHAPANAAAQAKRYGLQDAYTAARLDILSQALGDFHDKLLMQAHYVTKPLINHKHPVLTDKVRRIAEPHITAIPEVTGCFSPVRAGFMVLNTLRIIDSFGKFTQVRPVSVAIPESMRPGGKSDWRHIMLPPRLLQPSRLNFTWTGGKTLPVQGWLIPNHADHNLALYDPNGEMLGFIQSTIDDAPAMWVNAPGKSLQPENLPEGLRQFAIRFLDFARKGVDALTPFLEGIDSALTDVNNPGTAEYINVSFFVGRPLALASAELWLELAHPDDKYKFPEVIKSSADPHKTRNIRFLDCLFPVRIGEPAHHADGVVGFFDEDFTRFHSDRITASDKTREFFSEDMTVKLRPRFDRTKDEKPIKLHLVIDPIAEAHLTSGILPQKRVSLPAEATAGAMAKIAYVLFTTPVVIDKNGPTLPHPVLNNQEWRWMTPGCATIPGNCDGQAILTDGEKQIQEGWLALRRKESHEQF